MVTETLVLQKKGQNHREFPSFCPFLFYRTIFSPSPSAPRRNSIPLTLSLIHIFWCCLLEQVEFTEPPCSKKLSARANAGDFYHFLLNTFQSIQDFSYQDDQASYEICNHLVSSCLIIFHQLLINAHFKFEIKNPTFAQEILIYMNEHYKEKIDLEHLSKVFFTSASHISSVFKKEYQLSPINYLIDKRLSEARWCLINTNETIQTIAERVGYPNHYYFTRLFQARTGYTPTDYREQYGNCKGA